MRELRLRVPAAAVEDVLDRLLPLVAGGVREIPDGNHVELRMRAASLPTGDQLIAAAGGWPHRVSEREVPDDWRERRLADYKADPIAGRLVVRPDWAPPPAAELLEIVLSEHVAFGLGTHPTTRACLELLLGIRPAGSFADLGCGSGVLAILAAKLGWAPVRAFDVQPESVQATIDNAAANGVVVQASIVDLSAAPTPSADGFAANVPAWLHAHVAATLPEPLPSVGLLSGFDVERAEATIGGYAARGFTEARRLERDGWVLALLARD